METAVKGVYELLESINVPETISEVSHLATSEMLKDITKVLNKEVQNNENYERKLLELKTIFVLSTNCGENEGTQTMNSTQNSINKQNNEYISFEQQVSKNLFAAVNHLEKRNSGADKGLLDIEECIQDTHKVLMTNLLRSDKTGEFSTESRIAIDDDHVYPKFDTKEEVYEAIQRVVDRYNATIDYIKNSGLNCVKQNLMYFRCAAWILYNFTDLHPFSDGNGRMSCLLASYCLCLVFPFSCPIYNIFVPANRDSYLCAIKKARCHKGEELGDLIALIIEASWCAVHYFQQSD